MRLNFHLSSSAMRNLIIAAAFVCGSALSRAGADSGWLDAVHLDSAADLEQLRATNPDHYARAVRILAAGVQLCGPGKPKLQSVDARDISCSHLLLTSNPPKSRLDFVLDNTQYVAIVTMAPQSPDNHVPERQLPKR